MNPREMKEGMYTIRVVKVGKRTLEEVTQEIKKVNQSIKDVSNFGLSHSIEIVVKMELCNRKAKLKEEAKRLIDEM